MLKSIKDFFAFLYLRLFRINDTAQRVSLGLGLGVFLGIIPGTGPIAALVLASCFRLNRASALIGSLLTNTWLSFVTFLLSIKIGSAILKTNWQNTYEDIALFFKNFRWLELFSWSVLKIFFPLIVGYFLVALSLGIVAYLIAIIVLTRARK